MKDKQQHHKVKGDNALRWVTWQKPRMVQGSTLRMTGKCHQRRAAGKPNPGIARDPSRGGQNKQDPGRQWALLCKNICVPRMLVVSRRFWWRQISMNTLKITCLDQRNRPNIDKAHTQIRLPAFWHWLYDSNHNSTSKSGENNNMKWPLFANILITKMALDLHTVPILLQ